MIACVRAVVCATVLSMCDVPCVVVWLGGSWRCEAVAISCDPSVFVALSDNLMHSAKNLKNDVCMAQLSCH